MTSPWYVADPPPTAGGSLKMEPGPPTPEGQQGTRGGSEAIVSAEVVAADP